MRGGGGQVMVAALSGVPSLLLTSGYWLLLNWLRDEQRNGGPHRPITFGISVRMTPNLKKHIVRLGESLWKPSREDAGVIGRMY